MQMNELNGTRAHLFAPVEILVNKPLLDPKRYNTFTYTMQLVELCLKG